MTCPFCHEYIAATLCQKYNAHVNMCKKLHDVKMKPASTSTKIDGYKLGQNLTIGMSNTPVDHPINDNIFNLINQAKNMRIENINSVDKWQNYISVIYQSDNCWVIKCLESSDKTTRKHVLSFLGNIAIIIYDLVNQYMPYSDVRCVVEKYLNECVATKQSL